MVREFVATPWAHIFWFSGDMNDITWPQGSCSYSLRAHTFWVLKEFPPSRDLKSFTRSLKRFYLGIDEEQSTMSGYMVITLEDPDGGENKYSCNLEKGIEDLKYPVDYDFEGLILECTKSV
ncbi:hypothetical protein EDC94DRAFT_585571 [Helicostylum pulchrum]|nr:hypothetical protein EDC94DRAFT_585571 [Helicostylum pulchrum]